jgi:nucleoid-associated protein YgaU
MKPYPSHIRRKKYILKGKVKKRLQLFCLLALSTIILVFFTHMVKPPALNAHEPVEVITVYVQKGDSLWKIAERYDNNRMDLRRYIDLIQAYNNLTHTVLQPGDRLEIPLYE